jgi:predicted nuclease of restriction endonuclease-like RecB superfamily
MPAKPKYHNMKISVDGIHFDSKAEAERYKELKMLKAAGEIKGFNIQPSFVLMNGIRYRPDFIICDKEGNIYVEDVKGFETKEFIIKKRMWQQLYPWMDLIIVKKR